MFLCDCGGVFLIKNIEKYPQNLNKKDQLEYQRKCEVECSDCGKKLENQPYD